MLHVQFSIMQRRHSTAVPEVKWRVTRGGYCLGRFLQRAHILRCYSLHTGICDWVFSDVGSLWLVTDAGALSWHWIFILGFSLSVEHCFVSPIIFSVRFSLCKVAKGGEKSKTECLMFLLAKSRVFTLHNLHRDFSLVAQNVICARFEREAWFDLLSRRISGRGFFNAR